MSNVTYDGLIFGGAPSIIAGSAGSTTKLSTILNDMNAYQTIQTIDEAYKVRFIDSAIKDETPSYKLPFRRRKTSMRVFPGVILYPLFSDYEELSYMDNQGQEYEDRARFKFQSYNEFLEDKDYRNDLAEVYQDGVVFLGCRYEPLNAISTLVNNYTDVTKYTYSGDVTSLAKDDVTFYDGQSSILATVVNNTGVMQVEDIFNQYVDSTYKRKYNFRWLFIPSGVTAITMKYGLDSSNYLYKDVSTQFSGAPFEADNWNLVAFDLNTANTVGTITGTFGWEAIQIANPPSGYYYFNSSYVKSWSLLDCYYYTKNNVIKADGITWSEQFIDTSTEAYDLSDTLIGPREWANYIGYQAMLRCLADKQDDALYGKIFGMISTAEKKLKDRFPVVKPLITNSNWRFRNDLMSPYARSINSGNPS